MLFFILKDNNNYVITNHDYIISYLKLIYQRQNSFIWSRFNIRPEHNDVPINTIDLMPKVDTTTKIIIDSNWVNGCPSNVKAAKLSSNYTYSITGVCENINYRLYLFWNSSK